MIDSRGPNDLAILVYTSGTTGPPKGAMHSNRSVTHQMRYADYLLVPTDHEERLVFLPLCHVAERIGGYYLSRRCRLGDELRRKSGDGAGQSARGAADGPFLAVAAHLGEVLFGHHHCAEGRNAAPAVDVSPCYRHSGSA